MKPYYLWYLKYIESNIIKGMKIKNGEIAEIYEYEDSFIVGKILHSTKEYLYIHNVSIDGTFQGYALIALKKVNIILYNTKYLTFFNKVLKTILIRAKLFLKNHMTL